MATLKRQPLQTDWSGLSVDNDRSIGLRSDRRTQSVCQTVCLLATLVAIEESCRNLVYVGDL